jgi:hypothetical protein
MGKQHLKLAGWAVAVLGALLVGGCGSSQGDTFQTLTSAQTTIINGAATELTLSNNLASVSFPANCFARSTIALISSDLAPAAASSDKDVYLTYYPTTTKQLSDLLAGLVINTPVDRLYHGDITAKMFFLDGFSRPAGDQYLVYRFDYDHLVWNRWGNITATVDPAGTTASVTLPTTGLRGFIGTIAIFKGLQPATATAYVPTTVSGTVQDDSGNPLATDVGIYYFVGTVQYPVDLPAGSGARIPSGGQHRNTVDSGADGKFSVTLPDYIIGQELNLEFGREDADHVAQPNFDVLSPQYNNISGELYTSIPLVTISYGSNIVRSRPVRAGGGTEPAIQTPQGGE